MVENKDDEEDYDNEDPSSFVMLDPVVDGEGNLNERLAVAGDENEDCAAPQIPDSNSNMQLQQEQQEAPASSPPAATAKLSSNEESNAESDSSSMAAAEVVESTEAEAAAVAEVVDSCSAKEVKEEGKTASPVAAAEKKREKEQNRTMPTNESPLQVGQKERRRISMFLIKAGAIVDGISVVYSDSNVVRSHGGEGGGRSIELKEHEYVKQIEVKHGRFVQRLCLTTNMGRELGPCGGGGALFLGGTRGTETTVQAPEGCMLVGMHGRAGKYLDAIGFHWAPTAACYAVGDMVALNKAELTSTKLFGGKGGGAFDHGHFSLP